MKVDAIVHSAGPKLCGGDDVDSAIHKAAGIGLMEECKRTNRLSSWRSEDNGWLAAPGEICHSHSWAQIQGWHPYVRKIAP